MNIHSRVDFLKYLRIKLAKYTNFLLVFTFMLFFISFAEAEDLEIKNKFYFGAGVTFLGVHGGKDISFGYSFLPKSILGIRLSTLSGHHVGDGSGNSSIGHYYKDQSEYSSKTLEVTIDYNSESDLNFFKTSRFFRLGLGYEDGQLSSHFERYDDDPGLFHIGSGLRLQETGPEQINNFGRSFVSIEPGVRARVIESPSIGIHFIEIGVRLVYFFQDPSFTYLRANSTVSEVEPSKRTANIFLRYAISL